MIKVCTSCHKKMDEDKFGTEKRGNKVYQINVCSSCKQDQRNKSISKSPKSFMQHLIWQLKSKRIKEGYEWTITIDDLMKIYNNQRGICKLSGIELTHIKGKGHIDTNISLDRINNDKGYTPDNIQIIAYIVNMMRRTMPVNEFKRICKDVAYFVKKQETKSALSIGGSTATSTLATANKLVNGWQLKTAHGLIIGTVTSEGKLIR